MRFVSWFVALVVCVPSTCVLGIHSSHSLHRLRESMLHMSNSDMDIDMGVDVGVDLSANLDAIEYAAAEATAEAAAKADAILQAKQSIASQLNNEMLAALGYQFDGKRIGVECEYQGAPRVAVVVKPGKIAAMKDEFKAGGKYAGIGAANWLRAAAVPLTYGNTWLESAREANSGVPYIKVMTDNEDTYPDDNVKAFWHPVVAAVGGNDRADRLLGMNGKTNWYLGLNAAMEVVTMPLSTAATYNADPNYIYALQAIRLWTRTLRKYTYTDGDGLATDGCTVSNMDAAFQQVLASAMGGDPTAPNNAHNKWLGAANMIAVPIDEVMAQFTVDLTAVAGLGAWGPRILNYDWIRRYTEYYLWQDRRDFPFSNTEADSFYERYFILPKLGLVATYGGDEPTRTYNLRRIFRFGPQLNFGFPVSKFGDDPNHLMDGVQLYKDYPGRTGYFPFTQAIWPFVSLYGRALYDAAVLCDTALHPRNAVEQAFGWNLVSDKQKADVKGFFVLFMHYYFIEGYLNLRDKFAHSVLLKSPLNDVIRALPSKSRRVIAAWWDSRTVNVIYDKLQDAGDNIWNSANVAARGYTKTDAGDVPPRTGHDEALAKAFIRRVFTSADTGLFARWSWERARVVNGLGVVTTTTKYGSLKPDVDDYPIRPVTVIAKTVAPFSIPDADGTNRPAVLLEHRDGDEISSVWGDVWNPPAATPAALALDVSAHVQALAAKQAPVLLELKGVPKYTPFGKENLAQLDKDAGLGTKIIDDLEKEKILIRAVDTTLSVLADAKKIELKSTDWKKNIEEIAKSYEKLSKNKNVAATFLLNSNKQSDKKLIDAIPDLAKQAMTDHTKDCKTLLEKVAKKTKLEKAEEEYLADCVEGKKAKQ